MLEIDPNPARPAFVFYPFGRFRFLPALRGYYPGLAMVVAPSPTSAAPDVLLHTIGHALLDALDVSVLSDIVIEATPEFAGTVWKAWDARADDAQKRSELAALAHLADALLEDTVERAVHGLGLGPRGEQTERVFDYLCLVPGAIRRHCRRPSCPLGTLLPPGMPLGAGWELLPLLPSRMPKFRPGDRPWNIGDWELRELIELTGTGEVWKAVNPRATNRPPVALHFFTHPRTIKRIREREAGWLDRVLMQGRVPGVVPIQELHLFADPPCVQMPFFQAADLASLVQEARETKAALQPAMVADLVQQIAETLGRLHTLRPALVHRDLRAANILLMTDATGRKRSLIANLGLAALRGGSTASDDLASVVESWVPPEQLRGDAPVPRDDVYALGVLWYQLLEGDLARPRPGGASWRRRLVARGMTPALVEVLETCFDDDPSARPVDGSAIATAMRQATASRV